MDAKNKNFLIEEYQKHNLPVRKITLNNESLIIPFEYAREGDDELIKKCFFSDYLDLQFIEAEKYHQAGETPRIVRLNGVSYIAPFSTRHKNRKDTEIIESILARCRRKYNKAVSLARKLSEAYPEKGYRVLISKAYVDQMEKDYRHYLFEKYKDHAKFAAVSLAGFVKAGVQSVNLPGGSRQLQDMTKKFLVGISVAGAVATAGHVVSLSGDKESSSENKTENIKTPKASSTLEKADEKTASFLEEAQKIKPFHRTEKDKKILFDKFMDEIFGNEGGYADSRTIDQPTNMGIIQGTLNTFWKEHAQEARKAKFPKSVKALTREQAKLIYQKQYFEHYRIGDYRNESIALLMFDMYVNHKPSTVQSFVNQGLKAARQKGALVRLPKNTAERVAEINKLASSPKAEEAFYRMLIKERSFFMHKQTDGKVKSGEIKTSRFGKGLKKRAKKYQETYIATVEQESRTFVVAAALQNNGR